MRCGRWGRGHSMISKQKKGQILPIKVTFKLLCDVGDGEGGIP